MRLARTFPALALGALLSLPAFAQHHTLPAKDYDDPGGGDPDTPEGCSGAPNKVQITGSSTTFSPTAITINAGQAVCWTWNTGGTSHNVSANDGSFSSGQPTAAGTFQRTFNQPGTYGYHCQVHGSPNSGMRGTVVVLGSPDDGGGDESGPGTLSFDPGAYEVDENAGTVTVTIVRTGGSDGKVTVKVTTANGSAGKGKDFLNKTAKLTFLNGDRGPKSFTVRLKNDRTIEADESFLVTLSKPTGSATIGNSSATVTIHDDDGAAASSALLAPFGVEAAGISGREVRLAWAADAAAVDAIHVERRGGDGDFREIAVVPAGVGEHVDAGLPSGARFHYRLRAERAGELSEYSDVVAAATDGAIGPCAAGAHRLCLGGGRFEAKVDFRGAEDEPLRSALRSEARAAAGTGLFAFGDAGDPDLMLKVVNGCADNDHFWVELAALTDAELEVSVRDTRTGRTWAFFNPAGHAVGAVRDLDAFGVCP